MSDDDKLEPCPWCGPKENPQPGMHNDPEGWSQVLCLACDMTGPGCKTERQARIAWNHAMRPWTALRTEAANFLLRRSNAYHNLGVSYGKKVRAAMRDGAEEGDERLERPRIEGAMANNIARVLREECTRVREMNWDGNIPSYPQDRQKEARG